MQEILKVYTTDGKLVLQRDLSEQNVPLMIVAGESLELIESAAPGTNVIGALVRDEDGWTLVSRKADSPVKSGPKSGVDLHLTVGVGCELAGLIYRLEREGVVSGDVLIWRMGGACTTDPLAQGRNIVASRPGSGTMELNPAVVGETLCEIYPTSTGIDVVTFGDDAARVPIERATLFSVGAFQGMVLSAADAEKAMKSGNPFAWPARGTRTALCLSLLLVGLVILVGAVLNRNLGRARAELASYRGAKCVPAADLCKIDVSDEDVLVYEMAFFRALPTILRAKPAQITTDLIGRGEQLSSVEKIRGFVKFLREVLAIQNAVQKGDWEQLRNLIAAVDHSVYVKCDAEVFLADAKEVASFVTEALPAFMIEVSKPGSPRFAAAGATLKSFFDEMKDNIFMSGEVIRRERDFANVRWEALSAYVPARDEYLSDENSSGEKLLDAWVTFVDAFDPEDHSVGALVERERNLVINALLGRADKADDLSLIRLCELGESVGIPSQKLGEWRKRADAAKARLGVRYTELYNDYRMKSAVAPGAPDTLAILDRMVEIGLSENRYHKWALREIERVKSVKEKADDSERKE